MDHGIDSIGHWNDFINDWIDFIDDGIDFLDHGNYFIEFLAISSSFFCFESKISLHQSNSKDHESITRGQKLVYRYAICWSTPSTNAPTAMLIKSFWMSKLITLLQFEVAAQFNCKNFKMDLRDDIFHSIAVLCNCITLRVALSY